jgi:hypothetical protein
MPGVQANTSEGRSLVASFTSLSFEWLLRVLSKLARAIHVCVCGACTGLLAETPSFTFKFDVYNESHPDALWLVKICSMHRHCHNRHLCLLWLTVAFCEFIFAHRNVVCS